MNDNVVKCKEQMNYYEQDNRRGRAWGIVGVVLYAVVCACIMFVTTGIWVDLGSSDTGLGDRYSGTRDVDVTPTEPQPETPVEPVEPVEPAVPTDDGDIPVPEPEPQPEEPVTPDPVPAPREVNPQALFPGRGDAGAVSSQGTAGGEGNQGSADGAPDGAVTAGGGATSGVSLEGRYLVGNLPRPVYGVEEEGRVVIRITVNRQGVVTGAVYEAAGSTTNNGDLVSSARAAALRARFTPSEAEVQQGTITYIFRLN